jgi:hypothetical protein
LLKTTLGGDHFSAAIAEEIVEAEREIALAPSMDFAMNWRRESSVFMVGNVADSDRRCKTPPVSI